MNIAGELRKLRDELDEMIWRETEAQRLAKALEEERAERNEAERRSAAERDLRRHTERQLSAQKAATTRAKKRHAAGVCPCCNRSFENVRRHMATQHPDFDPAKEA
jgi:DNA repair exonuclease SbcCD ATPase subunit